MTLKAKAVLETAEAVEPEKLEELKKYRVRNIPAVGVNGKDITESRQLMI